MRRGLSIGWLVVIGSVVPPAESAQEPSSTPPPAPPAPAAPAAPAAAPGLDPNVLQIEAMGLTMHMPAGGMAFREDVDGSTALLLADAADPPAWRMRVQELVPTEPGGTIASIAQKHLDQLKTATPGLRVLEHGSARVAELDAWLIAVQQNDARTPNAEMVNTWLMLPNGPGRFMVFAVVYAAADDARLKPIFANCFNTIRLQRPAEVVSERESRLDAGRRLLETFTTPRLRSLVGRSQWYRLYQPGATGDTEIGYSLLEIREGKRGELNPGRLERNYAEAEQQTGLLVSVQARLVQNPELGSYIDSEQLYWMDWDRSQEAWSVRATIRQGDIEMSEAETGVRTPPLSPANLGTITVIRSDSQFRARSPYEWRVPEAYLSQPEHWILGALLPHDVDQPREFSFYFFQSSRIEISQRIDRWERLEQSPPRWKLSTRPRPDDDPTISIFDDVGMLLQQTRPDGTVTVTSTSDQIRRRWETSGLRWGSGK